MMEDPVWKMDFTPTGGFWTGLLRSSSQILYYVMYINLRVHFSQ